MQPSRKTARRGRRETSLLRALNDRSLTGNPRGAKLWAEDESVFRHRLEYLDLAADTTRSTIAVAFSSDGYDVRARALRSVVCYVSTGRCSYVSRPHPTV